MTPLAWALFDNPRTESREYWCNGYREFVLPWAVIAWIEPTGLTVEERALDAVQPGRVIGNPAAIATEALFEDMSTT